VGDPEDMMTDGMWQLWFIPAFGLIICFCEWILERDFYFEKPKWFLKFTNQDIK
jgi:hypothetical protein